MTKFRKVSRKKQQEERSTNIWKHSRGVKFNIKKLRAILSKQTLSLIR